MSDSAGIFTSISLTNVMHEHGTEWRPVLAYSLMSNGRAKSMVGTIKKSVGRLAAGSYRDLEEKLSRAVYGYRLRPLDIRYSPYELMYGKPPSPVWSDQIFGNDGPVEGWVLENCATLAVRAEHALASDSQSESHRKKEV